MTNTSVSAGQTDPVRAVLEKAIDVIHEQGWARGAYVNSDRSVCLMGAVYVAAGARVAWHTSNGNDVYLDQSDTNPRLTEQVRSRIKQAIQRSSIADWNDNFARDADDVIDVLKRAAEL